MGPTSLSSSEALSQAERSELLQLAHDSIRHGLDHGRALAINLNAYSEPLQQQRATFVTLEIDGQLRGCIGMLQAVRPLVNDVAENAFSAAFSDPRFPPLSEQEFDQLDIHISILSPATPMAFDSEENLIAQLRPGVDGLILSDGVARGTFLPSVWESLSEPREFLQQLKRKAGLPVNYWSESIEVSRYTTEYIT